MLYFSRQSPVWVYHEVTGLIVWAMVPITDKFLEPLSYYFGPLGLSGAAGSPTVSCWCFLSRKREILADQEACCPLVRCGWQCFPDQVLVLVIFFLMVPLNDEAWVLIFNMWNWIQINYLSRFKISIQS